MNNCIIQLNVKDNDNIVLDLTEFIQPNNIMVSFIENNETAQKRIIISGEYNNFKDNGFLYFKNIWKILKDIDNESINEILFITDNITSYIVTQVSRITYNINVFSKIINISFDFEEDD